VTLRRKLFWVGLLYFAEGFPFGVIYDLLPVYFRSFGVDLKTIGLLSLLGMPWSLKVFWSPLVDALGERRHWMTACLATMGVVLACVPFFPTGEPPQLLWALLLLFTICAATQDIAIDAFTIGLMDKGEEGAANSLRVSAYRAALIVAGGGLVALAGIIPWSVLFWIGSAVFFALAIAAWRTPNLDLPPQSRPSLSALWKRPGRESWRQFFSGYQPLMVWFRRPTAVAVFAFILTYKLGDSSMGPMVKPFWLDRGLTPAEIGLISTTLGVFATVAGSIVGGIFSMRFGIFHGLWALGLLQALSNLGYAAAAHFGAPREAIYAASIFESFTGGMGTSAFLSFLMNVCDKQHAAVQYALLSALFGFTRSLAGGASGWATERLGYAPYFALTFLLAFPAYLLLPWVRTWIRERGAPEGELGAKEGAPA